MPFDNKPSTNELHHFAKKKNSLHNYCAQFSVQDLVSTIKCAQFSVFMRNSDMHPYTSAQYPSKGAQKI